MSVFLNASNNTNTMSNPLANNAVGTGLQRKHFLKTDREGVPLQGQVPFVKDQYTGAGNVSVQPGLSPVYYVNSTLASGVLNIDLTDNQDYNNMIGRELTVYVSPAAGNSVTVDITGNSGAGARAFRLTGDTGDIATITAGGWARFVFIDTVNCLIVGNAGCTTA